MTYMFYYYRPKIMKTDIHTELEIDSHSSITLDSQETSYTPVNDEGRDTARPLCIMGATELQEGAMCGSSSSVEHCSGKDEALEGPALNGLFSVSTVRRSWIPKQVRGFQGLEHGWVESFRHNPAPQPTAERRAMW